MKRNDFIEALYEELEVESVENLSADMILRDLEEYDSLAVMSIIALVSENFSLKLNANDFESINTLEDLLVKIGL